MRKSIVTRYIPTKAQKVYPIDVPCTKMVYNSEKEARGAILYLRDVQGIKGLGTYCCTKCGFYHLTTI
jgi:hypothetical protein